MYHCTSFLAAFFFVNSFFHCTDKRPSDTYLMINVIHVLVITRARVPYGKYWHSSDVWPKGRRPEGFTELLCKYFT